MSKEVIIDWLKEQQPKLESILLASAEEYYNIYSTNNLFPFSFDAKKTGEELRLLGRGEDLCYDRPTIGFNYSLWFHAKRVNTCLYYFTDLIYESKYEDNINIFDLGAGTGAVLWAVGLVVSGLKNFKLPCPKIRVVNVDTSPFMLNYNVSYLWKFFIKEYPEAKGISNQNDYRIISWTNLEETGFSNVWFCASYLFDHSENHITIVEDFKSIIEKHRPNKVFLLSALQKKNFVDEVENAIQRLNYSSYNHSINTQIFSGQLNDLYQLRYKISQQHNLSLIGIPEWDIDSLYGKVLINNSPEFVFDIHDINLYTKREEDRLRIKLTEQQKEAAKINSRPTLIIGPAGCGKSVVLTQKVKNIVDATKSGNNYNPNLRILVSTFNKELLKLLGNWIEQILEKGKFIRKYETYGKRKEYSYFRFPNSLNDNIIVIHFDALPTKIGNIKWKQVNVNNKDIKGFHFKLMNSAIEKYITSYNIDKKKFQKVLDPEFLLDEYQRIIYGNLCNCYDSKNEDDVKYSNIRREGRGNNPRVDERTGRRRIVWGVINSYLRELKNRNLESFIIRRHRFVKKLIKDGSNYNFTHILVDEFQDCTKADYEIFYKLLKDSNNFTLAGDLAQSINLGAALHIPKADDQRNFSKKKLEGSFRLPFRISECIKPLSKIINKKFGEREGIQTDIINPYRGAPPGSRPILIYAENSNSAAEKIKQIFNTYKKALELDRVTIFERDIELYKALSFQYNISSGTEIILRAKGLEKKCVVWSTRILVDTKTEKEEFIYTILSRTVSLLIVVLFPDIHPDYIRILREGFVQDRVLQGGIKVISSIRWDEETEIKYQELIKEIEIMEILEDPDDTEDGHVTDDENIDELNV